MLRDLKVVSRNRNGQGSPSVIRDPAQRAWVFLRANDAETVDQRRRTIGLPPLADLMAEAREAAVGGPPADLAERRAAFEDWAKKVGWR